MKQVGKRKAPSRASERPRGNARVCNIRAGDEVLCVYPLDDLLDQLGKRWTLLTIAALGNGRRRFNELQGDLADVSSRTLSERLKALEGLGLVQREAFDEVPLRVEYALTQKGEGLLGALLPLLRWAASETASSSADGGRSPS